MSFSRLEVEALVKITVDPSLSMMDRGFGVTSTSLAIEIKGLEPGPLPLSSPVSQKGEEEEDDSPLKEIGDIESILQASTGGGGEAPSQVAALPEGATLPTGWTCELRRGGKAQTQASALPKRGDASSRGILQASTGREGSNAVVGASKKGDVSFWEVLAMEGVTTGVPLVRRGEQLGLSCPKSLERAGPRGLREEPK